METTQNYTSLYTQVDKVSGKPLRLLTLTCEDDFETYFNFHAPSKKIGPIVHNLADNLNSSLARINNPRFGHVQLFLFDVKNQSEELMTLCPVDYEGVRRGYRHNGYIHY